MCSEDRVELPWVPKGLHTEANGELFFDLAGLSSSRSFRDTRLDESEE